MKLAALVLIAGLARSVAGITVFPPPAGETLSSDYQIEADGKSVPVYSARVLDPPFAGKEYDYGGPYSFATFDSSGAVEIRIKTAKALDKVVLRPRSPDVQTRVEGTNTLVVRLPGPRKLSIEPDGKRGPLLLFVNAPETQVPNSSQAGAQLIYYGPGVHKPGRIVLTNNQTLYLAGGAVVKAGIWAEGENIRITGRGILDGSDWEWRKGPTPHVISLQGTNLEVSGIIIRGASHWTVVPRNSRHVRVENIKICGSRVQNDDGINPCNSQDVHISDCFIRSDDDCVALKGLELRGQASNVEQITVENCILWCDRARIFLLGHESRAPYMRNITLKNLDVIHFTMTPFLFEPGEEMRLDQVLVENVRLHGEGQNELARLKPVVNQYMHNKVPGHISQVQFRNVSVEGKPGRYLVEVTGADADHSVEDVVFRHCSILAEPLKTGSPQLVIGPHTSRITCEP